MIMEGSGSGGFDGLCVCFDAVTIEKLWSLDIGGSLLIVVIRSNILVRKPQPYVKDAFNAVSKEESHRDSIFDLVLGTIKVYEYAVVGPVDTNPVVLRHGMKFVCPVIVNHPNENCQSRVDQFITFALTLRVERFMNYLEEQTDGEAMINSIKNGLPNDINSLIDSNKTAKDLWDALARHMLGSEYGEQDRKAAVLYEYEIFKATEGELLLDTYIRYLQVINDLKKCGYSKDNYVNDAMGSKKKTVVVTSDTFALIVEKMKVSKSKEKVVVSLDSKGSGADDFSELKKITALLAKDFNRRKFYSKPTNNNLKTSSSSQSANKKQEFIKTDNKKVEKKDDEKKRDMSRVKCYNCKKEGHFTKDCKKVKVKDYEYYKTKMLLAKKDKDEQVLLAEDQAWMESSSDSDQEINANMVFMAQIKKVLSDSEASSSSADEKISEVSYCLSESESESEVQTLEYYDNSTSYGLFVNNDDDQEIFHDAIESASKNLIENHIGSQKDYDKSDVDHNDSEEKDHLVDKKQIADQEVLYDKMSVQLVELDKHVRDLKNTILEKDVKIPELEECARNKDLELEKCLERLNVCENKLHKMGQTNQTVHMIMPSKDNLYNARKGIGFENPSYFEKAKDLRPTLYDEKFKRSRKNKIEFAYDYGNLNASYVNEKINFEDDYFQEIINPDSEKIASPFQQTSSLKPYVSNVILEKIIIDLEDEVVNLLEKEKVNLETIESFKSKGFDSSEKVSSESKNQSENDRLVVEKECHKEENPKNVEIKLKRKRRKRKSSKQIVKQVNNDVSRANSDFVQFSDLDNFSSVRRPKNSGVIWKKKGSSNTSNVDLSIIVQICIWIIDSRYSEHMTGNRALLTNFVEKFLGTVEKVRANAMEVVEWAGMEEKRMAGNTF
nr:hypothetical protein [Tanacetum cinerariifolium]